MGESGRERYIEMKLKDMEVFKESHKLAIGVYKITKEFHEEEKFGLTSQMRRAAVSIPSNLIEGDARHSEKEYIYFLKVAIGSCSELDYQLYLCKELGILHDDIYLEIKKHCQNVLGLLINTKKKIMELNNEKL
ncbi:four helix bundle protein [bacterium]|nr:four helix bundle protein [bacterium]